MMSAIVTSILSSTVGILWNKARDVTAQKLKEGDITEEKIREIVVRELNDIKSKLDGLSRKDLLSSYGFLKEGVNLLKVSLDKANNDEGSAVMNKSEKDFVEICGNPNHVGSGILNETLKLSRTVENLKLKSGIEFEAAKKRFEEARKAATHAFFDESLSVRDRIFAAKLRVCSEILEFLESPETAVIGCETFLQDLHSLPAIRETFSVYLNGGIKSMLNKGERVENVKSVMMINYVLYQFHFKFCCDRSGNVIWPGTIDIGDRYFNPILDWQEVSARKSWGEGPMQPRNHLLLDESIIPYHSALNNNGNVVALTSDGNIKVFPKTGTSKIVVPSGMRDDNVVDHYINGLAVDNNNNIYIVKCLVTRLEKGEIKCYVMNVLNEAYSLKHSRSLDFLQATGDGMKLSINNNNDIIIVKFDDPYVYVCDNCGNLKFKFERKESKVGCALSISNENHIIISSDNNRAIDIYSKEGIFESVIHLPRGQLVAGIAFHHLIGKMVVLSLDFEEDSYFLLCYSRTGELETSTFFSERFPGNFRHIIRSHPGVPMAIIKAKEITYI